MAPSPRLPQVTRSHRTHPSLGPESPLAQVLPRLILSFLHLPTQAESQKHKTKPHSSIITTALPPPPPHTQLGASHSPGLNCQPSQPKPKLSSPSPGLGKGLTGTRSRTKTQRLARVSGGEAEPACLSPALSRLVSSPVFGPQPPPACLHHRTSLGSETGEADSHPLFFTLLSSPLSYAVSLTYLPISSKQQVRSLELTLLWPETSGLCVGSRVSQGTAGAMPQSPFIIPPS